MPEMALISVDLPAPLSPTSATTSPAPTSKSTSVRASTAPKRLVTPLTSRRGFSGAAVAEAVVMSRVLLDPVLGAGLLVGARADLGRLPVVVGDHGVLDRLRSHRLDVDLQRRNLDRSVVLGLRRVRGLLALKE